MRIANVIEEARLGGPQTRMVAVAGVLRGNAVTTIMMPEADSEAFRLRCEQLEVAYRLMPMTRLTWEWQILLKYILFLPYEILRLRGFIRKGGFDLVHNSGGSWQYKGVIAGKLAGTRVLWHLNDTRTPVTVRCLFRLLSPLADGFVFASQLTRDYYRPLIKRGRPEFVIPAPVDVDAFAPGVEFSLPDEVTERWRGKYVVGTVANVTPVKGLETFLRMAARLGSVVDDLQFVVVGAVHHSQQKYFTKLNGICERLGVRNVEFVGRQSDVRPWLQRFDVYVCSSNAESSPMSVWEAMAMGKAVVSTRVGDVPAYVRNGESGALADVGDADAMAQAVQMLLESPARRRAFGSRARQTMVDLLDISHCTRRHLECYRALVEQRADTRQGSGARPEQAARHSTKS